MYGRAMRRTILAVSLLAAGACVDVPDSVRAEFAAARPGDRSNFRPGPHGLAPPVEDPPAIKAASATEAAPAPITKTVAPDAGDPDAGDPDAGGLDAGDSAATTDADPAGGDTS